MHTILLVHASRELPFRISPDDRGNDVSIANAADWPSAERMLSAGHVALVVVPLDGTIAQPFRLCHRIVSNGFVPRIPVALWEFGHRDPRDEDLAIRVGAAGYIFGEDAGTQAVSLVRRLMSADSAGATFLSPASGHPPAVKGLNDDRDGGLNAQRRRLVARIREEAPSAYTSWQLIWLLDLDYRTVWMSPAFEERCGLQPGEWMRRPFEEHFAGESGALARAVFERHIRPDALADMERDITFGGEFELYRASGTPLLAWCVVQVLRDDHGHPTGIQVIARDISQFRRDRERVRLQTSALEATANAIVLTERNGDIVWVNSAFSTLTGYTADEVIGRNPRVLKSGKQDPAYYATLWNTIAAGAVWHGRLINRRKDGSEYVEELTITPIKSDDGSITHFVAIKQDISDRIRAEESLRLSEARFRTIFEQATVGMLLMTPDGRMIEANETFARLLDMHPAEVSQSSCFDITDPDDVDMCRRRLQDLLDGHGASSVLKMRYRSRSGQSIWANTWTILLRDQDGNPLHFVSYIEDITDQQRAADEIRRNEMRLQILVSLSQRSALQTEREIVEAALEECGRLLESSTGFCVFYTTPDTADDIIVWPGEEPGVANVRPDGDAAVITKRTWERCVRERRPMAFNDVRSGFSDNAGGMPAVSLAVRRLLTVPVFEQENLMMVLAVGRTTAQYDEDDERQLMFFASDVWKIIQRKRISAALAASERRYRAMIERSSEIVGLLTASGIMLYNGPSVTSVLGYGPEELQGRSLFEFMHPEDVAIGIVKFGEIAQQYAGSGTIEFRILDKGGRWRWIEATATNLLDDASVSAVVLNYRDVTDRKTASEALRRSEVLYRAVVESVDEVIAIVDRRGVFHFVNTHGAHQLGVEPEDVVGKSYHDLFPPPVAERQAESVRQVIDRREKSVIESESVVHGRPRWYRTTITPVRDEDGGAIAALVLARDVTAQKEHEHDLRIAKEQAERSDRLKDAFIANISHEIRTPLNIISGYSQVIADSFGDRMDTTERGFLDSISRGAERLMRTVDEILNYSRLQTDDIRPSKLPARLDVILAHIVEDVRSQAERKGLGLQYVNSCGDVEIPIDEYYIVQAFNNLLDNAMKYTPSGSIEVLLYADRQGLLCADIADTGIGIAAEYIPELFQPYSQEETGYNRGYEGIGLGLALVKRYIELHGGSISVRSEKGVGSTFTIHFNERIGEAAVLPDRSAAGNSAVRPRVLIVEDDPETVEFMEFILSSSYDVVVAGTADAAWRILLAQPVHAVCMDVSLRGSRSGLVLTREIRADASFERLPIVAVTAHAFDSDKTECLRAGCDAVIVKPFHTRAFLELLAGLTDSPQGSSGDGPAE